MAHLLVLVVVGHKGLADLLFIEAGERLSKEGAAAALENGRRPLSPAVLSGKNKNGSVIAGVVAGEGKDCSQAKAQKVAVPFFFWMLEKHR